MSKYQQFIFESYQFDPGTGILHLHYAMDDLLHFVETYTFDFPYVDYDPKALDRALQALFFMAGVSYYKTYIPPEIIVKQGELDTEMAAFFSKTYQRGLGEFWYVNKLDPRTPVTFPITNQASESQGILHSVTNSAKTLRDRLGVWSAENFVDARTLASFATTDTRPTEEQGLLVAIGGGKDSLVTVELLRDKQQLMTWSVNHRSQLTPLVDKIALPHAWVERTWDKQLFDLNKRDALNGHIPISGIFACVGTIIAILAGKRDVVMSNEQSANEPTLHYQGVAINHQYSKSQEFERDYQAYLAHTQGDSLRYYSLLRPLSELRIAEIFAKVGFEKYKSVFSSCNRAFVHSSDHMSWCGECSKCAFVFLALTPFVARKELEALWGGKNLLLDPSLEPTYRKLLGIEGDKPLDCVGDIKESRSAMREAFKSYPELAQKYQFDIPKDYDFRAEATHQMPQEIYSIFSQIIRD